MSFDTERPNPHIDTDRKLFLVEQLPFSSFQATFWRNPANTEEVAKVYGHQDLWGGMIPLGSEVGRSAIIQHEITCAQTLAPNLHTREEQVVIHREGHVATDNAIVMREIAADNFLYSQLQAGNTIAPHVLQMIAERVAAFHFDPSRKQAEVPSMDVFLHDLMHGEWKMLNDGSEGDMAAQYRLWDQLIQEYIERNKALMNARGEILGDPIIGHGDIKSQNIAVGDTVDIIDPAPVHLWLINDRRMDAMFLNTELQLSGRPEAAALYWQHYDARYQAELAGRAMTPIQRNAVEQSTPIMDRIASIYRLTIFHRLAVKKGVDPESGPISEQLLKEEYDQIQQELAA